MKSAEACEHIEFTLAANTAGGMTRSYTIKSITQGMNLVRNSISAVWKGGLNIWNQPFLPSPWRHLLHLYTSKFIKHRITLLQHFQKKNTFCYTPMKNLHRNEFGDGEKPRTIVGFYSFLILSPQTEKTFVSIFPPANGRTQSYVFPIRSANIFYNHIIYIHISIHKCLISSIS